ncbi:MAG: MFS transporter [Chloroflexi bacterium]|nr:MFS transporter [Chloroflexota bacterium]
MSRAATRLWSRAFALACVASFTVWTAAYTFLGILALYALSLGVPETWIGLFPAASTGCGLVAQLIGGRLLVRGPRTRLMRWGPLLIVAGALLASVWPSPLALFAACMLLGSGYGVTQTGAVVLATEVAPPARRGEAVGIYGTFTTLAVLIGPPIGVALLQHVGARVVFLLTLAMATAALGAAWALREPPPRTGVAHSTSARLHPLVYFAALTLAGMSVTWGTVLTFVPAYALGLGLSNPGLYFSAQAVAVVALRAAMGGLSDRLGRVRLLIPATLLVVVGVGALALRPPIWLLLLSALVYGVGYAAFHPTTIGLADDVSSPATRGTALGLVGGAFSVGVGSGAIGMGWVLGHSSYEVMFLVAALVPLCTTGALVLAARHYGRPPQSLDHYASAPDLAAPTPSPGQPRPG